MASLGESIERDGFALARGAVDKRLVDRLLSEIAALGQHTGSANLRSPLMCVPSVREVFDAPAVTQLVELVAGSNAIVTRSLLFDKVPGANWNVPWHQDQIIAVEERREVEGFTAWSRKQGVLHARPPAEVLERMLTLRLHLDACPIENGPLKLLAGSHQGGYLTSDEIARWAQQSPFMATAEPGDLLLMRPLLLHASDRAMVAGHRRVLHFDLACQALPAGLEWHCELALMPEKTN